MSWLERIAAADYQSRLLKLFGIRTGQSVQEGFYLASDISPVVLVDTLIPTVQAATQLFTTATAILTNVNDVNPITVPAAAQWSIEALSFTLAGAATPSADLVIFVKNALNYGIGYSFEGGTSGGELAGRFFSFNPPVLLNGGDIIEVVRVAGVIARSCNLGVWYRIASA